MRWATSSVDLGDGSFENARIPGSAFGGSPRGHEFGDHHGKAQQVITDTIRGVTTDLETFRDGVQNAVRLVRSADETSADDLNRKREIADGLQRVWTALRGRPRQPTTPATTTSVAVTATRRLCRRLRPVDGGLRRR